jgi:translation initiation factor 1 (eIF-1/SUI1)
MDGDKHADSIETTERNGRKTLTTVQGLPKKFDQKKILKVIKKKFGKLGCSLSCDTVTCSQMLTLKHSL